MKGFKTILFCCWALTSYSQSDSTTKKLELRGYIKSMQIASFDASLNNITNDNLIHNRLNFRYFPSSKLTLALELRNRLFFGETVDAIPNYADLVDQDNGYADMSWSVVDQPSLVLLTQIDRAWAEWSTDQWEVRLGRQRINWGTNLFWNANDLFNAYSLVDFDYEERPGVDALRIQKHFKKMNSIDVAVKPGKDSADWIGAVMYRFNKWRYDFQLLSGWWHTDYVVGAGWAGNIWRLGFKGELSYFIPNENGDNVLSASISSDYVFGNQLFLSAGFLFNSTGVDTSFQFAQNVFVAPLSAKSLMPTKYSGIVSISYPFSPIFSGGLVSIYSPGVNTLFLMPSLNHSISNNWEVALFGQAFWMKTDEFKNIGNGIYLRFKWSF
jgi:hypothetical protein